MALFLVGTNAFVIAGVLPEMAATFEVSPEHASYAITWYAAVVAVAAPVFALAFRGAPRNAMMTAGVAGVAAGTWIAALAPGIDVFIGGRILAGLGGAALVPTVLAAVPNIVPVARQGRALATVEMGFALASAAGAPLGTALGAAVGWRGAMLVVAVLATLLMPIMHSCLRGIAPTPTITLGEGMAVLGSWRIGVLLLVNVSLMVAFNVVYVFSSVVAYEVTLGEGSRLALLLAVCGIGGLVGNTAGGRLVDACGSAFAGILALVMVIAALAAIPMLHTSNWIAAAFFAWGLATQMAVVAQQYRLFESKPEAVTVSMSWNSSAMYVGIALAPVLGAQLMVWGPRSVAVGGAAAAAVALLLYAAGIDWRASSKAQSLAAKDVLTKG